MSIPTDRLAWSTVGRTRSRVGLPCSSNAVSTALSNCGNRFTADAKGSCTPRSRSRATESGPDASSAGTARMTVGVTVISSRR